MGKVVELLALTALLVVGAGGWGHLIVRLCARGGWRSAPSAIEVPLRIAIGMSLFLSVGGLLVAVNFAWFWCLLGWQAAGCVLLLLDLVRTRPSWGMHPRQWQWILAGTGAVVLAVGYVVIATGNTFGGRFNWDDDIPGYMYLTHRLLATGGLIDPFNLRRVSSYGGAQLYDALFLKVSGVGSLQGFEFLFAALVVIALVVMHTRRRWLLLGTLIVGVSVLAVHPWSIHTHSNVFAPPLPVTNLAPEFSVAALTLAVFHLAGLVPETTGRARQMLCVIMGLCLAGIMALRFTFVIAAGVAVLIVLVASRGRKVIVCIGVTAAAVVVASLGWAVASLRSSGTPLLPISSGNYDKTYCPARDPFFTSIGDYARLFWKSFTFNTIGFVAVACLLLAVIVWVRIAPARPRAVVLLGGAVGCIVELVVLTVQFTGALPHDVARFEAPSTLACALFAVSLLWPERPPQIAGPEGNDHQLSMWYGPSPQWLRPTLAVLLVVGLGTLTFGYDLSYKAHELRKDIHSGIRVLDGAQPIIDPYGAKVRDAYHQMNRLVPSKAKVLAAVDDPGLLDFSKFDFATVDFPGAASPPPHLPLFKGTQAVLRYLRSLGYSFLVADSPTAFGFYNRAQWKVSLKSDNWTTHQYARYFLQWLTVVDGLEQDRSLHKVVAQRLTLIDLR